MASKAVDKRTEANTVDPRDEPSAEWGWHGGFPVGTRVMGWFIAFALFIMLIGNHRGDVENLWLIGLGIGVVGLLLLDIRRRRTAWRR